MTAVNLLLLALLKNSGLRAEHALQRKLDAIAAALLEHYEEMAALQGGNLRRAAPTGAAPGDPAGGGDLIRGRPHARTPADPGPQRAQHGLRPARLVGRRASPAADPTPDLRPVPPHERPAPPHEHPAPPHERPAPPHEHPAPPMGDPVPPPPRPPWPAARASSPAAASPRPATRRASAGNGTSESDWYRQNPADLRSGPFGVIPGPLQVRPFGARRPGRRACCPPPTGPPSEGGPWTSCSSRAPSTACASGCTPSSPTPATVWTPSWPARAAAPWTPPSRRRTPT